MQKKGFTLIELMVAITILAILSSIALVTYGKAQAVARDAKRKDDLRQIQVALELYKQKNGHYPYVYASFGSHPVSLHVSIANNWDISAPSTPPWIGNTYTPDPYTPPGPALDSNYISSLPVDPINSDFNYIYAYKTNDYPGCPGNGKWYALETRLENANDPVSVGSRFAANDPVTWCDDVTQFNGNDNWSFIYANTYLIVVK